MKLLFDQNLSFKLCTLLSDLFSDYKPVRELGLDRSDDRIVWQHAKDNVRRGPQPGLRLR
jgi:predicted nuclease of predicted toxin-antitoxin system